MFETMLSAATRMTSATVTKMTTFSRRSAKASGALSSRHVCDAVAGAERGARAPGPRPRRFERIGQPRLEGAGALRASRQQPRRRLGDLDLARASRARSSAARPTTRSTTETGIGPIGESRVRDEVSRTDLPDRRDAQARGERAA